MKKCSNKKYYGDAVQVILDTAIEKYCIGGEENIQAITRLLNIAFDIAYMYDLKEIDAVFHTCAQINSLLQESKSKYSIYRKGYVFFSETI